MSNRSRFAGAARSPRIAFKHFINPYPFMSEVEAMVHLDLERRGIPFSWRYFDPLPGEALNTKALIPDFAPEFTLREYHIVILVLGSFWGNLPGILDRNALAQALLEYDGWKVLALYEQDIRSQGAASVIDKAAPELVSPAILGPRRPNPFGNVDLMAKRREQLKSQGLLRKKFSTQGGDEFGSRNRTRLRTAGERRRRRTVRNSESGKTARSGRKRRSRL